MSLNRKNFLRQVGLGVVGLAAAGSVRAAGPSPAPSLPRYDDRRPQDFWRAVRSRYAISPDLSYLNCGGLGPAPRRVTDCLARTAQALEERVDGGHGHFDAARKTAAGFLGADLEELCFTRNATEGNSIVAAGLRLSAGDEVIFESHAHPGGSLPWLALAKARGVVVKVFVPDPESAEGNIERIGALVTPRTRVIQVSHVTAPTGIVLPVQAIARFAAERGIWFHVDGAQAVGMIPVDVRALGCDSYAVSGHKWLGGPRETGVLYIKRSRLEDLVPVEVGAYSSEKFDFSGKLEFVPSARRFEYGTRNAAAVAGLAEAMRFQEEIGRDQIAAYGAGLADRLHRGLRALRGVSVLTPAKPELRGSITTFKVADWSAEKLFGELMGRHHLRCRVVTEENLDALRVSTHLFNGEDECDRLIAAVAGIVRA